MFNSFLYFVDRASRYVCNETNLMHYLSPAYSTTIPLHVHPIIRRQQCIYATTGMCCMS
jgi:hypothetical protein